MLLGWTRTLGAPIAEGVRGTTVFRIVIDVHYRAATVRDRRQITCLFYPPALPYRQIVISVLLIKVGYIDSNHVTAISGVITSVIMQFLRMFGKLNALLDILH